MTCIVGVIDEDNGEIIIGGDSAISSDDTVTLTADSKVWVHNKFVFGYSGSLRVGQSIKYHLVLPRINCDPTKYIAEELIEAIRKCLRKHNAVRTIDGEDEHCGGFIVGFDGKLFEICSDYGFVEAVDGYLAIGSGADKALGSLFTTDKYNITAEDRVILALEAAERYTNGVKRPFNVVRVKY